MKTTFLLLAIALGVSLANAANPNDEPTRKPKSPFQSVTVIGESIVAKLPAEWRRCVSIDAAQPRLTNLREAIAVRAGETLVIHGSFGDWSYVFTPRFQPKPGFDVTAIYDTRPVQCIPQKVPPQKRGIRREVKFFAPAK